MIQSRKDKILEYFLIVLLIVISGTNFGTMYYYKPLVIIALVFVFIAYFFKRTTKTDNKTIFVFLFLIFILLLGISNFHDFTTYIAIVLQILIGFFASYLLPKDNFKNKYINVMMFLCVTSLIFFVIGFAFPNFYNRFPVVDYNEQTIKYNAFLYEYHFGIWTGRLELRNNGIFWEPGCYQFFVNLSLLFELRKNKKITFKAIVFIITVLTTVSTTGIIILFIVLLFNYFLVKKKNTLNSLLILVVLACLLGVGFFVFGNQISKKIDDLFMAERITDRINFDLLSEISKHNIFDILFGISFSGYNEAFGGAASSFIYYGFSCGLIFIVVFVLLIIKSSINLKSFSFLIIVAMSLMSESLLIKPFTLMLLLLFAFQEKQFKSKQTYFLTNKYNKNIINTAYENNTY